MRRYAEWESIGISIPNRTRHTANNRTSVATRDVSPGNLFLGQLKGRALPIALKF